MPSEMVLQQPARSKVRADNCTTLRQICAGSGALWRKVQSDSRREFRMQIAIMIGSTGSRYTYICESCVAEAPAIIAARRSS
jgi:hypothetical protein